MNIYGGRFREMGLRLLLLVLGCSACCPGFSARAQSVSNSPKIPAEFRNVLAEWRRLEDAEYNLTGSYKAKKEYATSGGPMQVDEMVIRTKPGHKLFAGKSSAGESVYSRSSRYVFVLKRKAGEPNWLLVQFTEDVESMLGEDKEEKLGFLGKGILAHRVF